MVDPSTTTTTLILAASLIAALGVQLFEALLTLVLFLTKLIRNLLPRSRWILGFVCQQLLVLFFGKTVWIVPIIGLAIIVFVLLLRIIVFVLLFRIILLPIAL